MPRDAEPPPPPGDAAPADPAPAGPPLADPPLAGRRLGDVDEPRVPRGCNPLVFGVVMATVQFGCTVYFMRTC